MKEHFESRTYIHRSYVKFFAEEIVFRYPEFHELLEIVKEHDLSKFEEPEYTPYLYINWKYKCIREEIDWEIPTHIQDQAHEATVHHVLNNKHHPEYWSGQTENIISKEDRDGISTQIDGTKMPLIYIAEMVADWFSVSVERGTEPRDWADKNVNKRWMFTDEQVKLIYDIIERVWES